MRMGAKDAFSGMVQARWGQNAAWQRDSSGKFHMTGSTVKDAGGAQINSLRHIWKFMSDSVKGMDANSAMFALKGLGKKMLPGFSEASIEALAISNGSVLDKIGPGLSDEELIKGQMYSEKEIGIKLLTAGEHAAMLQRMMLQLQTAMFNTMIGVLNMILIGIGRLVVAFTGGTFFGKNEADLKALSGINSIKLWDSIHKTMGMIPDIAKAAGMSKESAVGMFSNLDTTAELFSGKRLAISRVASLPEKDLADWRESSANNFAEVKNSSSLNTLLKYTNPLMSGVLDTGNKRDSERYNKLLLEAFTERAKYEREHNAMMVAKWDKMIETIQGQKKDTQNGPFKNN
jgi:hypothetical protein